MTRNMSRHRNALIVQALILVGLILAAVFSAPTRAAPTEVGDERSGGYERQMGRIQADYVRVSKGTR